MARPTTPLISRDGTATAALHLVEERGLDGFTLADLARHLGVRAPSLYHHFDDKDAILTAAAQTLLAAVPLPPHPEPAAWKSWFRDMCLATYRIVMARPRAAGLLVEYFPRSLVFPGHDRACGLLIGAGVPIAEVASAVRAIEKLSFGLIVADATELASGRSESADASGDDWPAYRAALDANTRTGEQMFVESIDLLLDGIESRHGVAHH